MEMVNTLPNPSATVDERMEVLWAGSPIPPELERYIMSLGFDVKQLRLEDVTSQVHLGRVLILEIPFEVTDLSTWAQTEIGTALDFGLRVALVKHKDMPDDVCFQLWKAFEGTFHQQERKVLSYFSDGLALGSWILQHHPGPSGNSKQEIQGVNELTNSEKILLNRALHDLEVVRLQPIQGGKSGAKVWVAYPSQKDRMRRAQPFLIKLGPHKKSSKEKQNYLTIAQNVIPFRLRPSLHNERCVEGASSSVLVFDFIDHAQSFLDAIQKYPADQLIGSLFGHTLHGCLDNANTINEPIQSSFDETGILRWSPELEETANAACKADPSCLDFHQLKSLVEYLPTISHRIAQVHGDLHANNLFVAAGSSDVIIIDFASMGRDYPAVVDPACLEVSLLFPSLDNPELEGPKIFTNEYVEWLHDLFVVPSAPYTQHQLLRLGGWRGHAVRAIRLQAFQHEPNSLAYTVGIASYLLKYASYNDHARFQERVLAYNFASRMFSSANGMLFAKQNLGYNL